LTTIALVYKFYSEFPGLCFHKIFERHPGDTEMVTDIWDLHRVLSQLFHRDHCKAVYSGLGNDEGVGIPSAF